jgi:FG-GAP repeat
MRNQQGLISFGCAVAVGVGSLAAAAAATAGPAATNTHAGLPHAVQTRLAAPSMMPLFGAAVAMDSDTIAVGSRDGVTLYRRTAGSAAVSKQTSVPVPPGLDTESDFGAAVALESNLLVVGASLATTDSPPMAGVVYIYQRPAGGWRDLTAPTATLNSPGISAGGYFGSSVAVQGNEIVVGATRDQSGSGAVYVFTEPAGGWAAATPASATLTGDNVDAAVGSSVAIDGNVIAAGAPSYENASNVNIGAVDLYVEPASGGWVSAGPTRVLDDSTSSAGQDLGESVALYGPDVIAGAPIDEDGGTSKVDVFAQPAGGWAGSGVLAPTARLTDPKGTEDLGEGLAVGKGAIVTGGGGTTDGVTDDGAVEMYAEPASGWKTTATPNLAFRSRPTGAHGGFGDALALGGGQLVVGAQWVIGNGTPSDPSGSAYVYTTLPLPRLTSVRESKSSWAPGSKLPALNPKQPVRGGAAYRFAANQAMPVTLSFAKKSHGHYGNAHKLTVAATKGRNVMYFDGRLSRSTKLGAGKYRVVLQARNAAGDHSTAHPLRFTIT